MNRVHNVTVLSPPRTPIKSEPPPPRSITEALQMANQQLDAVPSPTTAGQQQQQHRDRTRTHTLGADEVMVLRKPAIDVDVVAIVHKDPIAFEIPFDARPADKDVAAAGEDDDENSYEDDFDSYESDFDSYSSDGASKSVASSAERTNADDELPSESEASSMSDNSNDDNVKTAADQVGDQQQLQRANVGDDHDSGMFDLKLQAKQGGTSMLMASSADEMDERHESETMPLGPATLSSTDSGQMDSGFG